MCFESLLNWSKNLLEYSLNLKGSFPKIPEVNLPLNYALETFQFLRWNHFVKESWKYFPLFSPPLLLPQTRLFCCIYYYYYYYFLLQELELRLETQKQTLQARDESIKKLLEMLQTKGIGKSLINANWKFIDILY